ncbi:hypothetical protein A8M77_29935 [Variovorax sp. JS1663]|nr:hypothetical protein A8M77_29935 [Variovorax sp. JS1663]
MDLPHIVALREKLEATRMLAASSLCPAHSETSNETRIAYEGVALEYLVAVGDAAEQMKKISQSIAAAYALP